MQAIVITAHGGPEVLAVTELPDPVPAASTRSSRRTGPWKRAWPPAR